MMCEHGWPPYLAGSRVPVATLSASERLDEVAEILAAGLSRLRSRQSSALSADVGESSLDCADDQSGHADVLKGGLD
jgi:hypothetical protein